MLRLGSLQDHRTPLIPSSGTSANLYHQLISPLVRPEVWEIHQAIALKIPTTLTFPKSNPFDNIWVPIKICVFPFSKSEMIRS